MIQLKRNKLWYLEHFSIFKTLKKEQLIDIENRLVMKNITKSQVLFLGEEQMPRIYILKKGIIKIITQNADGDELIKAIIKPGEIFGEIGLLETDENQEDYAVALEDGIICQIEAEYLKELMQTNQSFKVHIYKIIGLRIKKIENRLSAMIFKDAETRIADFLKEFVIEYGTYENNYYYAKFFLTHNEVGKLTATTRQTVNKMMNNLREEGQLEYSSNFIKMFIPKASEEKKRMIVG